MGLLAHIFHREATVRHQVERADIRAVLDYNAHLSFMEYLLLGFSLRDHLCGPGLAGLPSAGLFSRRLSELIAFCTSVS